MLCPKCHQDAGDKRFCAECGTPLPTPLPQEMRATAVGDGAAIRQVGVEIHALNVSALSEAQFGQLSTQLAQLLGKLGVPDTVGTGQPAVPLTPQAHQVAHVIEQKVEEAQQRFPLPVGDPAVYFKLGNLAYGDGSYQNALDCYNQALALSPDEPQGWDIQAMALFNKGVTLGQLGRSQDAIAVYDQVVQRFGDRPEAALAEQVATALYNKGVTLKGLGQRSEARQCIEQCLRLTPGDKDAQRLLNQLK